MFNIAVLVNTLAVVFGSLFGMLLKSKMNDKYQTTLFQAVGIVTVIIGVKMGLETNEFVIVLASLALGGVIGQWVRIEERIASLANRLEKSEGETSFVKGFVTATVLFVVGPMTILGCFSAGIDGDFSLLFLKSTLDFIAAIILSSLYAFGVMASALSVYVVQGLLVTFASQLTLLAQPQYLGDFSGVGGAIMIIIGIRLTEIKEMKAGNYLPALGVVVFFDWIASFFV
ncbi:MAG TPA: DUF554 domain-containing protein [Thermotogota bacterium]|mgnify:CR=1 FL=1|nr:DUF554 domain-containing protein [Thermotogota bacterium]HPJ89832.1 DUF554 domain-containing protein [Thermotogota bacterium]HPR96911.1 DUF554 domain-containing protein [Thermotogota bacterium]